jgi:hypothetical protein
MNAAHLLALLALPVPSVRLPAQDGLLVAEGTLAHGVCWFHAERAGTRLAEELRDVAEAAWIAARPWTGAPAELDSPLTVNLYAKRKEFVAAVDGTQPGASKGRVAWGDWGSRQVHVKLRPLMGERSFEQIGLPAPSLRAAAGEVAGLARGAATDGERRGPRWFNEGLDRWCAEQAMGAIGRALDGVHEPAWSTLIARTQDLARGGRLPTVAELVADEPGELNHAERLALHAVFFDYLAQAGGEPWTKLAPRVAAGLSGEALAELLDTEPHEAGFPSWLNAQQPAWVEDHPALADHGEGWVQTPLKGRNAVCWSTTPPPAKGYTIRGEFYVYRDSGGKGQVNVVLGRLPNGDFISVSFNTPMGVHAWRFDAAKDAAGEAPFVEVTSKVLDPPLSARNWIAFEIHVVDERVFVTVGDTDLAPFDTVGRPMDGLWGLGTLAGSIGLWRGVECVSLDDR